MWHSSPLICHQILLNKKTQPIRSRKVGKNLLKLNLFIWRVTRERFIAQLSFRFIFWRSVWKHRVWRIFSGKTSWVSLVTLMIELTSFWNNSANENNSKPQNFCYFWEIRKNYHFQIRESTVLKIKIHKLAPTTQLIVSLFIRTVRCSLSPANKRISWLDKFGPPTPPCFRSVKISSEIFWETTRSRHPRGETWISEKVFVARTLRRPKNIINFKTT